jgi:hypothetical protein
MNISLTLLILGSIGAWLAICVMTQSLFDSDSDIIEGYLRLKVKEYKRKTNNSLRSQIYSVLYFLLGVFILLDIFAYYMIIGISIRRYNKRAEKQKYEKRMKTDVHFARQEKIKKLLKL